MNVNPKKRNPVWSWFALVAVMVVAERLVATQVIMAPPPVSVTPPALQPSESQTNAMEVFIPAGSVRENLPQPFKYGPVTVRPHLSYRFMYGDGIQSAPTNQQKTVIQEISPGILVELGRHWTVDYTPTIRFYSNKQFRDGVDHAATLTGGTRQDDWSFGLMQNFTCTTAPLAETGTQAEQQSYTTALSASCVLNNKMSADFGLNQNLLFTEGFQNSREWSTTDWLNYQFWPRLTAGVGAGLGYVNVDSGSDQTYEQLLARVNWRATDKISFQVNGGIEDRQFLNLTGSAIGIVGTNLVHITPASDLVSPVFGAAVQYAPFKHTQISLNASRSVAPSLFQNEVTETTSFGGNLNQRLLKKFQLNLGGGYNIAQYTSSLGGFTADRRDNYYYFNARLSHPFLKRGTCAVFYQYSDNQSTAPGFSYKGSQIGFEISYGY